MGQPPIFQVIQAISPEYYNQLENLYRKAFEVAGISEMSAQSRKPSGLDSGKAIREFNDIQSQRFLAVGQSWEKYHLDISRQLLNRARSLAKSGKNVISLAKSGNELEEINWKDVDLAKDKYLLQVFPTSFLPRTPAGKLQAVQELVQAFPQFQDAALTLLVFPDVEGAAQNLTAPRKILEKISHTIVEKGEYIGPEPYMNLQQGVSFFQTFYLRCKLDNVEEEKLDLIRKWMDQAANLLAQQQPPQPPQLEGMPPEGLPQEEMPIAA